jgi:hypothetical protein
MVGRHAMVFVVLATVGCSSGPSGPSGRSEIDDRIRTARARFVGLTDADRKQLVAFCEAARATAVAAAPTGNGYLQLDALPHAPSMLADLRPTTVRVDGDAIALEWWNNSHAEEDSPHPAFEVVCATGRRERLDQMLAPGVWLRDVAGPPD